MKPPYIALLVVFCFLCACGTTPTIEQEVLITSDVKIENLANEAFERWNKDSQLGQLILANAFYKTLYKSRPDDINLQYSYYYTSILLTAMGIGPSQASNEALFETLNPRVKLMAASPGRLLYLEAQNREASDEELIKLLVNAIRLHPQDAFPWHEYSTLMEKNRQLWFAVSLAKQAVALNPQSDRYVFQLADTINDLIQNSACMYEQKELAKRAAHYYGKAAALKPEEQLYIDNSALQYLRLGVIPIAYTQAKKAFGLEQNRWTSMHYAESAILLKKYKEATLAVDALNTLQQPQGHAYAALIAASQGNWLEANRLYQTFSETSDLNTQERIVHTWLIAIGSQHTSFDNLSLIQAKSSWEKEVLDYLQAPTSEEGHLIERASNICEKTEAHFYTAMRYWLNDKKKESLEQLKLTTKQGATLYIENIWAQIMLESLFTRY